METSFYYTIGDSNWQFSTPIMDGVDRVDKVANVVSNPFLPPEILALIFGQLHPRYWWISQVDIRSIALRCKRIQEYFGEAVRKNNITLLRQLLPLIHGKDCYELLWYAVERRNLEMVELLLTIKYLEVDKDRNYALSIAIHDENLPMIKLLMGNVHVRANFSKQHMELAITYCDDEIVEYLLNDPVVRYKIAPYKEELSRFTKSRYRGNIAYQISNIVSEQLKPEDLCKVV